MHCNWYTWSLSRRFSYECTLKLFLFHVCVSLKFRVQKEILLWTLWNNILQLKSQETYCVYSNWGINSFVVSGAKTSLMPHCYFLLLYDLCFSMTCNTQLIVTFCVPCYADQSLIQMFYSQLNNFHIFLFFKLCFFV